MHKDDDTVETLLLNWALRCHGLEKKELSGTVYFDPKSLASFKGFSSLFYILKKYVKLNKHEYF